ARYRWFSLLSAVPAYRFPASYPATGLPGGLGRGGAAPAQPPDGFQRDPDHLVLGGLVSVIPPVQGAVDVQAQHNARPEAQQAGQGKQGGCFHLQIDDAEVAKPGLMLIAAGQNRAALSFVVRGRGGADAAGVGET